MGQTAEEKKRRRDEAKERDLARGIVARPSGRAPVDDDGNEMEWNKNGGGWVVSTASKPGPGRFRSAPPPIADKDAATTHIAVSSPDAPEVAVDSLVPVPPTAPPPILAVAAAPLLAAAPSSTIEISDEELALILHLRESRSDCVRRSAPVADPATSVAAAMEARASLMQRLHYYLRHAESCWEYQQRCRPSLEVLSRFNHLRAAAGLSPVFNPQPESERKLLGRPRITGVCEKCVQAYEMYEKRFVTAQQCQSIAGGTLVEYVHGAEFQPCQSCLDFEIMMCAAGGRCRAPVPTYLLDR